MRKQCPRCKSLNTRVLSPTRMSCRNCRHTWSFVARSSSNRAQPTFFKGKQLFSKPKQQKVHKA